MGMASKVCSVILRLLELISAAVVAGLVGEYLHFVDQANASANSKMVYTVALAGISLVVCLICMVPLNILFYGFLLDAALFVMWMTAFGLLVNVSKSSLSCFLEDFQQEMLNKKQLGNGGCDSYWYWSSWGWYYGGWYSYPFPADVNQSLVGTAACGKWRATIAWSFIGGWCWLLSAFLVRYFYL